MDIKTVLEQARDLALQVYRQEEEKAKAAWDRENLHPGFGQAFIEIFMDGRQKIAQDILRVVKETEGLSIRRVERRRYHLVIEDCFSPCSIAQKGCEAAIELMHKELEVEMYVHAFHD